MRVMHSFASFLLVVGLCAAQTTGVFGVNDFVANNNGSAGTSCVQTNIAFLSTNADLNNAVSAAAGDVLVPLDGTCAPGFADIDGMSTYYLDLFPFNITIDPFASSGGPLSNAAFLTVPMNGTWNLTWVLSAQVPGLAQQFGVLGAAFATGVGTTQAHSYNYPVLPMAPANPICGGTPGINTVGMLSDDGTINYVFVNGSFSFYGVMYSDVWVNMNGNLTFGMGDTDFTSSESEFLADEPRIAPTWDDFTPSDLAQGDVLVVDTPTSVSVEWYDVRHFGSGCTASFGNPDTNTFCASLDYGSGLITFSYADMGLCAFGTTPSTDQLVGISPGGGLSMPNNVDLASMGAGNMNVAAGANDAIYEDFSAFSFGAYDLANTPAIFFVPMGIGGAGPYTQN